MKALSCAPKHPLVAVSRSRESRLRSARVILVPRASGSWASGPSPDRDRSKAMTQETVKKVLAATGEPTLPFVAVVKPGEGVDLNCIDKLESFPAHAEFYKEQFKSGSFLEAGPLVDHTGVQRLGLIVLRANDLPQAQAILDRDPFTQAGVTVPAVYEWLRLDPRILPYLKGGSGTDGGNGGGNQGVPPVRPGPRIDTLPQTSPLVQKLIKTSSGPRFVALTIPKDRSKMEKLFPRHNPFVLDRLRNGHILEVGPFLGPEGSQGALIVLAAEDFSQATALNNADPFLQEGAVESTIYLYVRVQGSPQEVQEGEAVKSAAHQHGE